MRRIIKATVLGGLLAAGLGIETSVPARAAGDVEVHSDNVLARDTDIYRRYFRAGETVVVVVSGDGDTDLDLYVQCPCLKQIAHDDDPSDDCVVRFTAPESGWYTIKIVNRGHVSNNYKMAIEH